MDVYLTKSFLRDAQSDGITDEDCQDAIRKAERGLVDADLGGGLIKQRIARGNRGSAKGSRAILFHRQREIAIFLHSFPKNRKAALSKLELAAYLRAAREFGKLHAGQFGELVATKGWRKLRYDPDEALPQPSAPVAPRSNARPSRRRRGR
jgi:hypothetical protein